MEVQVIRIIKVQELYLRYDNSRLEFREMVWENDFPQRGLRGYAVEHPWRDEVDT